MPPTLLEVQDLAIIAGTNTLTRIGTVFGMIFVFLAGVLKNTGESRATKERHMREQRTYSSTQTHAYTPDKDILQDTRTPMTIRRASRFVSFVLGLVLGTGVAVLLAQLSAWLAA
jgi:hypothetical protein